MDKYASMCKQYVLECLIDKYLVCIKAISCVTNSLLNEKNIILKSFLKSVAINSDCRRHARPEL